MPIKRLFNYWFPQEKPGDPNYGIPGAAFFHPDTPWLDRIALIHDMEDDLITAGLSPMTFRENDERFLRALDIWMNQFAFKNNLDKRQAELKNVFIWPIFRAYRWLRDQGNWDERVLELRANLQLEKQIVSANLGIERGFA